MFAQLVVAVAACLLALSSVSAESRSLRSFPRPNDMLKVLANDIFDLRPASAVRSKGAKVSKAAAVGSISAKEAVPRAASNLHTSTVVGQVGAGAPVITGTAAGWVYSNFWPSCESANSADSPYVSGGSVIGFCVPSQATHGNSVNKWVYFDSCNGNTVNRYVYNTSTCTTNSFWYQETVTLPSTCQYDADKDLYYKSQCTNNVALPLTDEYVVVESSVNSDNTVQCKTPDEYTAYAWNKCIPRNVSTTGTGAYKSYKFGCSSPTANNNVFARAYSDAECQDLSRKIVEPVGCSVDQGNPTTYHNYNCVYINGTVFYDDSLPVTDDTFHDDDQYVFPDEGFFVVDYFQGSTCADANTFSVGYRLNQCLVAYDEADAPKGSVQATCDPNTGSLTYKRFLGNDCTGAHSENFYPELNSCASINNAGYGGSYAVRCSFGSDLPVNFNSVLVTGFEGEDASTCGGDATMFLAYAESSNNNFCFPTGASSSVQLECSEGANTYGELIYGNPTCGNVPSKKTANFGCFSTDSSDYNQLNNVLNVNAFSEFLFDNRQDGSELEQMFVAETAVAKPARVGAATVSYFVESYFAEEVECEVTYNTSNTDNYIAANQGYAIDTCLVVHNNNGAVSSYKYTCDGTSAHKLTWNSSTTCAGNPSDDSVYPLNQCQKSIGTSYGAYAFTCPNTLNLNDGFAYTLKYDTTQNKCQGDAIAYSSVRPGICISTDLQSSSIYSCTANNNEITQYTFTDAQCADKDVTNYYPETCQQIHNPNNAEIVGYYSMPYCGDTPFSSYLTNNFFSDVSSCDLNNNGVPPQNQLATQGWIVGECIVAHNDTGIVSSYMYTCSGNTATKMHYNTPDCSGDPADTDNIALNTCKPSVGTSYGASGYTCNANPVPIHNGMVYQWKYAEDASNCEGAYQEYSAITPGVCVSTDTRTSSKYECSGNGIVQNYYANDPTCSGNFTVNSYSETCKAMSTGGNVIEGYYTMPYCFPFDDYHPTVDDVPDDAFTANATLLYEYVNVECHIVSPEPTPSSSSSSDSGLSAGAIAGIAIGAVAVIGIAGYFIYAKVFAKGAGDLSKSLVGNETNENPIFAGNR